MADNSITYSVHFLQELEKNLMTINTYLQQILPLIEQSKGICHYLEEKCEAWEMIIDQQE